MICKRGLYKAQYFTALRQSPLTLLVGLFLIRGIIYLSVFPPFLAPDETAHFEAIRLIGQENKWPTHQVYLTTPMHPDMDATFERFRIWTLLGLYSPVKNLGVTDNLFIHYYPTQIAASEVVADSYLMLYHVTLAPLAGAVAWLDLAGQVYLLRFVSVLIAAASLMAAWVTLRALFPQEKIVALGACSFIVFWPMHSHVTASINADVLAELIGSLFFWLMVQIFRSGLTMWRGVMVAGLLGLAVLTKPTLYFLFPTLAAALIIYLGQKFKWPNRVIGLATGLLIVATWAGALLLYQNSAGGRRLLAIFSAPLSLPPWADYITPAARALYIQSLNFALISFGGLFGWSNIHIPWWWVRVLALLCFLVMGGVLLFIYQNLWKTGPAKLDRQQKQIALVFLLAMIFSFSGIISPIVATQSGSWAIHSRYYFPVIIPISLYLFMGVRQLVPAWFDRFLWPGWLIAWIFYDSLVFLVVLIPYLYS